MGETRRQLYDSGAYRGVEIDLQPVADSTPPSGDRGGRGAGHVDARIQLLERPRYRVRYGFAFNDDVVAPDVREQRLGLAADFERRNLFGGGGNAGVATPRGSGATSRSGRVFLGANRFFGAPLRSTVFLEREP